LPEVETDRLFVLLIHIKSRGTKCLDGIAQQSSASALAAPIGVYEQHLDLALRHGDEAGDLARLIAYTGACCDLRERIAHQWPEELNIRFVDEMMCRTDGCLPNLYAALEIFGQDWENAGL
jgi:hypothetical protein